MRWRLPLLCFVWLSGSSSASGQTSLTFEDAVQRARVRAPEILAAAARIDEARGRVVGASIRWRDNPMLEVDAGPRIGSGQRSADLAAAFGQTFETGGQRDARILAAQSDVSREQALSEETARQIVSAVAVSYLRAVGLQERVRLLDGAERLAKELQTATERRYQLGDIAALDLNLARIAVSRATAERVRAEADRTEALRPLRVALGLSSSEPVTLTGTLDRTPAPRELLLAAALQAPVLRAADAEMAQASAELKLAHGMRRPDLGVRVGARREQDDHILSGGVTVTLPISENGQGLAATAQARMRRVSLERDAASRALQADVEVGLDAYARRLESVNVLRTVAIPAADDNEQLATRSYEAGELGLLNLLAVRQDVTAARLSYLDARIEAAITAIEIDARAGVLR